MKKRILIGLAVSLLFVSTCFGAWDPTRPTNDELKKDVPAVVRANWDAIALLTDPALQITNAKVAAAAGIVDTKLAQITTANKVSGTALTGFGNIPSGAGVIPIANIPDINGAKLADFPNIPSGAGAIPDANMPSTLVKLTGDQTIAGIKTFSSILVLPASDPTTDNEAVRKAFLDEKFNTSTGHDHDGSDSKKVLTTNMDTTGGTNNQIYRANGSGGGAWGDLSVLTYSAGDHLIVSADTERNTDSTPYAMAKEIIIGLGGTLRIKFDGKFQSNQSYARIYRNGVAVGTEQTLTNTYQTFSEDIAGWSAGDLVQLYTKGLYAYVKNFRIYVAAPLAGGVNTD